MIKDQNLILWLQEWYFSNCDGDWEHDQNVLIETIDNPGWTITIKLEGTILENHNFFEKKIDRTESDWYYCCIENNQFKGACGPLNMLELIQVFKDLVEKEK